jgi:hypothetical protein
VVSLSSSPEVETAPAKQENDHDDDQQCVGVHSALTLPPTTHQPCAKSHTPRVLTDT